MNIFTSTSPPQSNLDFRVQRLERGKKWAFIASLIALSCLAFSSVWANEYTHAKIPVAAIHLTSLSIQIGPGGFHLGVGAPFYGRAYGPSPRHYWKHSRQHLRRHHHYDSPKRFNRGHGWKNDRHRGHFGGKSRGGNRGGHRDRGGRGGRR